MYYAGLSIVLAGIAGFVAAFVYADWRYLLISAGAYFLIRNA